MLVKFGNNWIQRPSPIWQSEEFFSSNYFQIGQHVVLLHIQINEKQPSEKASDFFGVSNSSFFEINIIFTEWKPMFPIAHVETQNLIPEQRRHNTLVPGPLSLGGHVESHENKKLWFCTASLALNSRLG